MAKKSTKVVEHIYTVEPPLPEDRPCDNCKLHPATCTWVGDGGVLAWTHGFRQRWCDCCALKAQLNHARDRAAEIPKLEQDLVLACKRVEGATS